LLVNRSIEIISSERKCSLSQTFAQLNPVSFYMREVIEHKSRDGHVLQQIFCAWLCDFVLYVCALVIAFKRNETQEATRFVLLLPQQHHVVHLILNGFTNTSKHGGISVQSKPMRNTVYL